MSLVTTPNDAIYIKRLAEIFRKSALLFPKSVGGDEEATDLVNQIIEFEIPVTQDPPEGGGPPHIVITRSKSPLIQREQVGRDSRDEQGPERLTLEFYAIIIAKSTDLQRTEAQLSSIVSAVTTTIDKNKRWVDESGENPLAATTQWIAVPYLLDSDDKDTLAQNILVRPKVYVNLRES